MQTSTIDILSIEAKAVLIGMEIVWDKSFRQVEVECDNAMLMENVWNGLAAMTNIDEVRRIHD